MWCIQTIEYYSALQKEILPCNNMDKHGKQYAKLNKLDREKQMLHCITDVWNLKTTTKKSKYKNRVIWWLPGTVWVREIGRGW